MGVGYATFPGLFISRADMVLTHGVTPSVCHIVTVPQETSLVAGNLVIGDTETGFVTFRECAVDAAWDSPPYVKRGARCNLRLLDRRWKWKGRRISGRYNVRRNDAIATADTAKTYRELFDLLFIALGEGSVSDITVTCADIEGPTVEWSCARADLELAKLVEDVGGILYLGLDDNIHIVPRGIGPAYPPNGKETIRTHYIQPATNPYLVRVDYGPTRYQSWLLLEAVGLDVDGVVKPIDDLTYKPAGGWRLETPGLYAGVGDPTNHALAAETVYRWYRIKSQWDESITVPGGGDTISAIADILPISTDLILPNSKVGPGNQSIENDPPALALIRGFFWDGDLLGVNAHDAAGVGSTATVEFWDERFVVDCARGIVKFDEYMYQVGEDGHHDPAGLWLNCSYSARKDPSSSPWHYGVDMETGTGSSEASGVAVTARKDLFKWVAQGWADSASTSEVYSNEPNLQEHGRALGESFAQTFRGVPQHDQQWAGIVPYSLNGNIHQMRWVIGNGPAMTYGSQNAEVAHFGPSYRERRIREEVDRRLFP